MNEKQHEEDDNPIVHLRYFERTGRFISYDFAAECLSESVHWPHRGVDSVNDTEH